MRIGLQARMVPAALMAAAAVLMATGLGQAEETARSGRFWRGTGDDPTYHSFVIPLDGQKGVALDDVGGNATNWFWPKPELWEAFSHWNATSATHNITFENPIAAFGGRVGGTALYTGQRYRFGIYSGLNELTELDDIAIDVYAKEDMEYLDSLSIYIPEYSEAADWRNFATNGFSRTYEDYGLELTVKRVAPPAWDTSWDAGYVLTHKASDEATNYVFVVNILGYMEADWMVEDGNWSPLYTIEFEEPPPMHSTFLDQPHFTGIPVPPDYYGKGLEESGLSAVITNQIWLTNSSDYIQLDASPELRRHPILDEFIARYRGDALALASFVLNEIELSDPLAWADSGQVTAGSVNLGGVNRSALGTFLERRGSPLEQCALLIYLLRQAGHPAGLVFPTNSNLKMLDSRLSTLLRMQLRGAVDESGQLYTTNTLITVNYPWVVANINSNKCVHIFPWLKDTEIVEGLNLYDFLPYENGAQWVRDYVYGEPSILGLGSPWETPRTLFPKFIEQSLREDYPGISIDDLGTRAFNRKVHYARWEDLPKPSSLVDQNQVAVVKDVTAASTVVEGMSDPFDTVQVQVYRPSSGTALFDTEEMRMCDIHNRKFLLFTNQNKLNLWLAPLRPGTTNQSSFGSSDPALTNRQVLQATLQPTDDEFIIQINYQRHRSVVVTDDFDYLGVREVQALSTGPQVTKADLVAICIDPGRTSQEMLRVHAQEFWLQERKKQTNSAYVPTFEDYQGTAAYLMGMSYFERLGEFSAINDHLHKVTTFSWFNAGLAKLRNVTSGGTTKVQPGVDMLTQESMAAANRGLRPDQGQTARAVFEDRQWLAMANGSAEEHAVLNSFFDKTNAVSTVALLQLAQARSGPSKAGIVELDHNNYVTRGNQASTGYGSTALKNHDSNIWNQVVAALTGDYAEYVRVFITPGPIVSEDGSYTGMGALIYLPTGGFAALIGPGVNGGFGSIDVSFLVEQLDELTLPYSLKWQNGFSFELNADLSYNFEPVYPTFEVPIFYETDYFLAPSPYQIDFSYNLEFYVEPVEDFEGAILLAENSGYFGEPSNLRQEHGFLADPVNTLSGEFYVDATDLSLPGPMPLQLRRNYLSRNLTMGHFGFGWKLSQMPHLVLTTNAESASIIYAAEADGTVVAYRETNDVWKPLVADNPTLDNRTTLGTGSTANMFNARIEYLETNGTQRYLLITPDGSIRRFEVASYPILTASNTLTRTRPYLVDWVDHRGNAYEFFYGQDPSRPDYGELVRIQSSNGAFLIFEYDTYGRIIQASSGDGRTVEYAYDDFGDLTSVVLPDASEIRYEYKHYSFTLTNGGTITTNLDSRHLLVRELKPDGRVLENEYDAYRRVTNQLATVGEDLDLVRNGTFQYFNDFNPTNPPPSGLTGYTLVSDVFMNVTRYDYTNGLITKVDDPVNPALIQDWFEPGETNKAGYYQRSLEKLIDKRGLVTEYRYDQFGNVTNLTVRGDLTGDGSTNDVAVQVLNYTTNHLVSEIVTPVGNTNRFFYTNAWLLSRQENHFLNGGNSSIITNAYSYYDVSETITNGTTNFTIASFGLRQVQTRAFGSSDAATTEWSYDGRGFLTSEVRYTGTGDPNVTNRFVYNGRGELVERQDAAGRMQRFDYDGLGRPKWKEVFDESGAMLAREYSYYNANGELVWSDGPRYDPEDYVWRDYDGAGRQTVELLWRSRAKEDGTGVEADTLYSMSLFEYDGFGNQTKAVDPRGNYRQMAYDAIGQMTREIACDSSGAPLATNSYAYEPGGKVSLATNAIGGVTENKYTATGLMAWQRNPDGSTNAWRYNLDGRLATNFLSNGAFWVHDYEDATRRRKETFYSAANSALATNVFEFDRRGNLIRRVDAAGYSSTNYFDGLDRIKRTAGEVIVYEIPVGAPEPPGGLPDPEDVQVATTNYYDSAGMVMTNVNALGDKTITEKDSLGRVVRGEVRDAQNTLVRETTTSYSSDHHSVTVTEGSGAQAITTTTFTDNQGRTVLSVAYPAEDVSEFTRREYDVAGNLVHEVRASNTNGTVLEWTEALSSYDGLNRLTTRTDRDGATTQFGYDPAGNLTNRVMPGGLRWVGRYNSAGQILQDYNTASGVYARTNTFSYYAVGNAWAGKLQAVTNGVGVVCVYAYDDWLRTASATHSGPLDEQDLTTTWTYDARGLLTEVEEAFADPETGPDTAVTRTYNAYGRLDGESVFVDGLAVYGLGQSWDSAMRRRGIGFGTFGYTFGWHADGRLAATEGPTGGASYDYATSGLLNLREVGSRTTTLTNRDGAGRVLTAVTALDGTPTLEETLTWTGDGLLSSHFMERADDSAAALTNDTRRYTYASHSRRLIQEELGLEDGVTFTNSFVYDGGQASGPGVLSWAGDAGGAGRAWTGVIDALSRVKSETNNMVQRIALGTNNAPAFMAGYLDGKPVPVTMLNTQSTRWRVNMELASGSHTLEVAAMHPNGFFTAWDTNTFTLTNGAVDSIEHVYDGQGQITKRIWRTKAGQTNRVQTLSWDARGRLLKVTQVDASNNGFNWSAVYDPLGRRVRTTSIVVSNGVSFANTAHPIEQFYDPEVEFLELAVAEDGRTTWKLYGPDQNGVYGGMNGTGGFDAFIPGPELYCPIIADVRGNVHAIYDQDHAFLMWYSSRITGYGSVPGHRPLPMGSGANVAFASAWRSRWSDITGLTWLGARYYDPIAGRFLSSDPLGHDGSPELYAFCGGDPINYFDADGRIGTQWTDKAKSYQGNVHSVGDFFAAVGYGIGGTALRIPGAISSAFGNARESMAQAQFEISTYTGGQAFLANTLRLPANFAFGTSSLVNDPVSTVPQIPGAIIHLPGNISQNVQGFANNPSFYTAFNLVENGLQVWGLTAGAMSLSRSGSAVAPGGGPRGVYFFGDDVLPYIDNPNATLGRPGGSHFFSPLEDVASVGSVGEAARLSGQAPSITRAYTSGGSGYGVSFPLEGLSVRLPNALDAGGNPNFLQGGRTAVALEGEPGGFLLNAAREYVTPGGAALPSGSVLFKIQDGAWVPIRRY